MDQVNLTLLEHSSPALANLRSLLIQFEQYHQIHVQLTLLNRETARQKLIESAVTQSALDVIEIEAAWICDFANLKIIYPFKPRDLHFLEGSEPFIPASWQACQVISNKGRQNIYAMPWHADTNCIYYRRDLLTKAGIDPSTAFASLEHFEQSIARLLESGVRIPLVLPTRSRRANLHNLVAWLWAGGGELVDGDGTHALLDQSSAMQSMQAYYRLGHYLPQDARRLAQHQAEDIFTAGLAGVMISGSGMLQDPRLTPQLNQTFAILPLPGETFVDTSHLAIWQKTQNHAAAMQLIEFLISRQAAELLHPHIGLPVRHDTLEAGSYLSHPGYHAFADTLRAGRPFPCGVLASTLLKQLSEHGVAIWEELFSTSRPDLDQILNHHVRMILRPESS